MGDGHSDEVAGDEEGNVKGDKSDGNGNEDGGQ
jgi:hypothetical protein